LDLATLVITNVHALEVQQTAKTEEAKNSD